MTSLTLRWHDVPLAVTTGAAADPVQSGPIYGSLTTSAGTTLIRPYGEVDSGPGVEGPFHVLEIQGPLDFSLTGVLASVLTPLAAAEISVFTLATFETDWVLIREADVGEATRVLTADGHHIERAS